MSLSLDQKKIGIHVRRKVPEEKSEDERQAKTLSVGELDAIKSGCPRSAHCCSSSPKLCCTMMRQRKACLASAVGLYLLLFLYPMIRTFREDFDTDKPEMANDILTSQSQRVVFSVGPHKTGSSSVQYNLMKWSNANQLGDWVWATPHNIGVSPKAFGTLLMNLAITGVRPNRKRNQTLSNLYRESFKNVWKSGKNIVIASEYGDFVLNDSVDGNTMIEDFLSLMPWSTSSRLLGSNNDLTVVVTYRAPRIGHFVSGWHWAGRGITMRRWISSKLFSLPGYMDPLGVAEMYANHNLSVVIMDTSGMLRDSVDISSVVACEVLGIPCNNTVVGNDAHPKIMNRIEMEPDLSQSELNQIDELLRNFDCNYLGLLHRDRVTILHGYELLHTLSACPQNWTHLSRYKALRSIQSIIQSN